MYTQADIYGVETVPEGDRIKCFQKILVTEF